MLNFLWRKNSAKRVFTCAALSDLSGGGDKMLRLIRFQIDPAARLSFTSRSLYSVDSSAVKEAKVKKPPLRVVTAQRSL